MDTRKNTSTSGTNITVRAIRQEEADAFRRAIGTGFGFDARDEDIARFENVHEIPRTVAAFDGDEIVGTGGTFTFELTIPGGSLPMAGTTIITVRPTHRRRGVLTAMMRYHFDHILERGEPLAGLWCTESSIYGRFGYGVAAESDQLKLNGGDVQFLNMPSGRTRIVKYPDAIGDVMRVFEQVRVSRPGVFSRHDAWWEHRVFGDLEHMRKGKSALRCVLHEDDNGVVDGYAIYRHEDKWTEQFPDGTIHVVEVMAATPGAHDALWQYLARVDLYPHVSYWNLPVDDALPWLVNDRRRVVRTRSDSMWLRVMDVPRALSARRYVAAGEIVLGIEDAFLPENSGAYVLHVDDDGAGRCERTDGAADVRMAVDVLGAIYLSGHPCEPMLAAGLIAGDDDAVAMLGRMFAWPVAPWCPQVF